METLLSKLDAYIQGAPLLALPAAFLAGLLTSFTPCVYPLIPITIGIIGAKSSQTRRRGFLLSLVYVLGLSLVYAALGAVAALTGRLFGQISTGFWAYFIVGNLFFLFGLSMLDVFSLQLTFLQKFNPSARGSGMLTAFIFGGVSALIAGPCTTPVLGTLLAFVASRQNVALGVSMLFLFAFGMGFLLIIVGTFTGLLSTIPRSGAWMVTIKKAFGFLMIGIGEYFILKAGQVLF